MTETTETTETVCYTCGDPVDTETGADDSRWANLAEDWQCWGCYESDESHAATIVHLVPGEDVYKVLWADGHALDLNYGEDVDINAEWPGLSQRWHSTDGWRGYTVVSIPDGWEPVDGGTALWGQHTRVADLAEDLVDRGEGVDREYLIVWAPTSNVFSITVDIFVKEGE